MIPEKRICSNCNKEFDVKEYSVFTVCPYCEHKEVFNGFKYKKIDYNSSMFTNYEYWTDCPKCRSKNMVYSDNKECYVCLDCKYEMTPEWLDNNVLWFCDECDTYLNIQSDFNTYSGHWICKNCGYDNEVTEDNVI